jgi:hypothetical protein
MAPKRTPKDLSNAWPGALLGIYHGTEPSRQICRIPITFLTSCGVTDVRSVVRRIAEATVKEAVRIRDEQGRPFEDIDVLAIRSLFLYPLNPHGTLTIVELPASKSRLRVANLSPSESTFSNSTDASGRSGQVSQTLLYQALKFGCSSDLDPSHTTNSEIISFRGGRP